LTNKQKRPSFCDLTNKQKRPSFYDLTSWMHLLFKWTLSCQTGCKKMHSIF
jgi:hypothetical protein